MNLRSLKSPFTLAIIPALGAIAIVAAVASGATPSASTAPAAEHEHFRGCEMHRGGRSGGGMAMYMMLKSAKLTDAQKAQVKQILEANRAARKSEREALRKAKADIAAKLVAGGAVTQAELAPDVATINATEAKMTQDRINDALAIRAILTPEQLKRVSDTRTRFEKIRDEMRSLFAGTDSPAASQPTVTE